MLILKVLGIMVAIVFFFGSRKYFFRWIGFKEPTEGFQMFFELPTVMFGMIMARAFLANPVNEFEIIGAIILYIILQDFFEKAIGFEEVKGVSVRQLYFAPAYLTGIFVGLL